MFLGFRLSVRCRFVAFWWMTSMRSFCFIIAFHNFATLENRLTYQLMPRFLTGCHYNEEEISRHLNKNYRILAPVQMNGDKFASGQILRKPVEVVKGRILAGWTQKSPKPWTMPPGYNVDSYNVDSWSLLLQVLIRKMLQLLPTIKPEECSYISPLKNSSL